jgi:hypothetical protein
MKNENKKFPELLDQKWGKPDVHNVAARKFVVELISPIKKKP